MTALYLSSHLTMLFRNHIPFAWGTTFNHRAPGKRDCLPGRMGGACSLRYENSFWHPALVRQVSIHERV